MAQEADSGGPAAAAPAPVERIRVRIRVGDDRMAASDDPLFLGLRGPGGREFRLAFAHGRGLRRGAEDVYVLGAPGDPEVNVAHPELNDPTRPGIDPAEVTGAYLRKGQEPIPNVRGFGEMDDRLQVAQAEVELEIRGGARARRFQRRGPLWLGLVCGHVMELAPGPDRSR